MYHEIGAALDDFSETFWAMDYRALVARENRYMIPTHGLIPPMELIQITHQTKIEIIRAHTENPRVP